MPILWTEADLFVRHNGGSVFFDRLGQPWPKHDCLLGDDSVVAKIRSAIDNSSVIYAVDLYQVLNAKFLPGLKLLSLELRDTNGRRTTWHISQFEKINALTGAIVALCRVSMQLIDSSGRFFIVNGPMIRCPDCEQWFLRRRRSVHRCAWSAVKISWKRANLTMRHRGHGLCVYAVRGHDRRQLAAFVEGFGSYHRDKPAVVRFDPRQAPADDEKFSVFKAALERRIRARDVSASDLIPGYRCVANA
jgi:hypothetical protein